MDAVRDAEGNYYHEGCAPADTEGTEFVSVTGMVCQECGDPIDDVEEEGDEPAVEVDED